MVARRILDVKSLARSPHLASPAELKARIEAERAGTPVVVYRDPDGEQHIVRLPNPTKAVTIGRGEEADICLHWDARVSRIHAELSCVGDHWVVIDDGLSRNGTHVNGNLAAGRRRLSDGDQLTIGRTPLLFRDPVARQSESTVVDRLGAPPPDLSPAQRRVLIALCRPFGEGAAFTRPATNQHVAEELHLTVAAVKTHLRALFERFGVGHLPQNEKRARLVQAAFDSGAVTPADLQTGAH
jgi:pSer/pThr/pTyr-binding forkhead associated (FHA) protein